MESIFEGKYISCYANCRKPDESRRVKMSSWLTSSKWYPKQLEIRALKRSDEKRYQLEKTNHLPAATMSGEFDYREASGLIKHSGFICLDIDRKDNLQSANFYELKAQFQNIQNVAYCGWSLSGEGYFILIPIAEPDRHSEYFEFFRNLFSQWKVNIDKKCGDVSRLRIYSHDPEAYFNHQAEPFRLPPTKLKAAPVRKPFKANASDGNSTRQKVEQIVEKIGHHAMDVTANDGRWYRIALALIDEFGENGRAYFHAVSQFHSEYDHAECDQKYTYFLKKARGQVTIGSFFSICQEFGIVYQQPEKPVFAKAPKPSPFSWASLSIESIPISKSDEQLDYPPEWDIRPGQALTCRLVLSPNRFDYAKQTGIAPDRVFSLISIS
ncbi:hypothetical protein GCM10027299_42220 [Larkinella ripae]